MNVSKNRGENHQNGWFIMQNPMNKWTIWGETPLFFGNTYIPGSSRYVTFLPFGRFFGWKGTNFTCLEDPGIEDSTTQRIPSFFFRMGVFYFFRLIQGSDPTSWTNQHVWLGWFARGGGFKILRTFQQTPKVAYPFHPLAQQFMVRNSFHLGVWLGMSGVCDFRGMLGFP